LPAQTVDRLLDSFSVTAEHAPEAQVSSASEGVIVSGMPYTLADHLLQHPAAHPLA